MFINEIVEKTIAEEDKLSESLNKGSYHRRIYIPKK